ncbi:hypothetical protein BC833DRAFT_591341 [Globomyces pollinis-pini]|nr:hypothetical protein BC833DRAFT_591341 [Globomyces pollinis-pini]
MSEKAYQSFLLLAATAGLGGSLWILSTKTPKNAFFGLITILAINDLLFSIGVLVGSIFSNDGVAENYTLFFILLQTFTTQAFSHLSFAISFIGFYIVVWNGSSEAIRWKLSAMLCYVPSIIFVCLLFAFQGSSITFESLFTDDDFEFGLTLRILDKVLESIPLGLMFISYSWTWYELNLSRQSRMQNHTMTSFRRLEASRFLASSIMMRFISYFTLINTVIWTPFLLQNFLVFIFMSCIGLEYPNQTLWFQLLSSTTSLFIASKGLFHALGLYYGLKHERKSKQRFRRSGLGIQNDKDLQDTIPDSSRVNWNVQNRLKHVVWKNGSRLDKVPSGETVIAKSEHLNQNANNCTLAIDQNYANHEYTKNENLHYIDLKSDSINCPSPVVMKFEKHSGPTLLRDLDTVLDARNLHLIIKESDVDGLERQKTDSPAPSTGRTAVNDDIVLDMDRIDVL